jgi:hypothetical protein
MLLVCVREPRARCGLPASFAAVAGLRTGACGDRLAAATALAAGSRRLATPRLVQTLASGARWRRRIARHVAHRAGTGCRRGPESFFEAFGAPRAGEQQRTVGNAPPERGGDPRLAAEGAVAAPHRCREPGRELAVPRTPPVSELARAGVDSDRVERSLPPAAAPEAHQRQLGAGSLERVPNVLERVQFSACGGKTRRVRSGSWPPPRGQARLARPGLARRARPLPPSAAGGVQRQRPQAACDVPGSGCGSARPAEPRSVGNRPEATAGGRCVLSATRRATCRGS